MDATRVTLLREVLASTGWLERIGAFARALGTSTRSPGGLLLAGTPGAEPWHLAAHLDAESRWNDVPTLAPTLVRWSPPPDAPPHLRVDTERLAAMRRGETVLMVSTQTPPAPLLERVGAARRAGANVFALESGEGNASGLDDLAHEALVVSPQDETISFNALQHLVSAAAAEPSGGGRGRGVRSRLARLLDTVTGPTLEH